ncbi:MAG: 1-acyl-sn-glycerol-3-phosphate acyltransferase [Prolixibacteraceae bacterium]|nr:1-acyl-sn-glycerol-3-phosphate acyltransferase [Prolixibacteraceae bacterium]
MYNKYFPENEYHTPANHKRSVWDILSLGGSAYFKIRFLKFVLQNRRYALDGVYDTARWAHSSYEIFKFVEDCGGKFHITGFDHVDAVKDEPVVFISNHMSTLETMIFPCLIAPVKEVTFVVKDNLIRSKTFGPVMRARDPIAVGRTDSRKDLMTVLNEGKEKLIKGTSIIIFPQSTRKLDCNPSEFNSLGVKLAQKNKVRIVPMAIKTDFWENGKLVKDLGIARRKKPIHIKFGEPMAIRGSGKEEHQFVVDFIQDHLREWQQE